VIIQIYGVPVISSGAEAKSMSSYSMLIFYSDGWFELS
jgi:hypothetical protein